MSESATPELHEIAPNEVVGRDVIRRFEAQFRGAALASLKILAGNEVDRVYCDFHEDYVVRELGSGSPTYHFVQVKTKGNPKHQWSRTELFGLTKKSPGSKLALEPGQFYESLSPVEAAKVRESFIGKLLAKTVIFGEACNSVTFETNVFLEDEVDQIAHAVDMGVRSERTFRCLADNFCVIFELCPPIPMEEVHANLRKFKFRAGEAHLTPGDDAFWSRAHGELWSYSEIDLTYTEGRALAEKLVSLVREKSSRKALPSLSKEDLDSVAGISLDDLLAILPVSKGAYKQFVASGDSSALKKASILQRKLAQAGFAEEMIEAASGWKIQWDHWLRTYRHVHELEIFDLQGKVKAIYDRWTRQEIIFAGLRDKLKQLNATLPGALTASGLNEAMLVGAVLAELVRGEGR